LDGFDETAILLEHLVAERGRLLDHFLGKPRFEIEVRDDECASSGRTVPSQSRFGDWASMKVGQR
jgi:hypothetical protein